MHEILRFIAEGVSTAPTPSITIPSSTDNSVKIAIITAISVVIAAAITAISATFTKRHASGNDSDQDYVDELVRRAEVAERRVARLEDERDTLLSRVDQLETYCWRAGIDANSGNPVVPIHPGGGRHGTSP